MQVIENENVVMVDVDETLVNWIEPKKPASHKIAVPYANYEVYLTPHQFHIDLVRQYVRRGFTIVVWSGNGYKHAKAVVDQLGMDDVVDLILSKPSKYMDDMPPDQILGSRVFFNQEGTLA